MRHEEEVRRRDPREVEAFVDGEQARRRRRGPSFEEIAPAQVFARLEASGSRRTLTGVRVTTPGYAWRWPWRVLDHADVVDCDLEGVQIEAHLLGTSRIDDCGFNRVAMGGARISGTTFTACILDEVSLAGTAASHVRKSTFRGSTLNRLDARGVNFDSVTFEDCVIDGLRGQATTFRRCAFVGTNIRGPVRGVVLDACTFDRVDMRRAELSRSFIVDSRIRGELLYPAQRSSFAIDFDAYRAAVDDVAPRLSDAHADALRQELGSWATNPPSEVLIGDDTFAALSNQGRAKAADALFERRLVRRGS